MAIMRENVEALIREALHASIIEEVTQTSTALSLMTRLPNMTSKQYRIPVLDMLPTAYWVNGDTGFKQTTKAAWDNTYLTAEEIAVIVPIPEAVLEDAEYDIIGQIKPQIVEAIHAKIDDAILFGIGQPASWQGNIASLARNAGNVVQGSATYENLMGEDGLISLVEATGKIPTGYIGSVSARATLRGIVDDVGQPIFRSGMTENTTYLLDGAPITFPTNGAFDATRATLIGGAFKQAVYSIRQDVTYKILDQAVIQDPSTGDIVYNLAQQDMIALRVVMRLGWALPLPATRMDEERTNVPFAILEPSTAPASYELEVTVTDGEDPIKGARVQINGVRRTSKVDGTADFLLDEGSYLVKVTKDGYFTNTATVKVKEDSTFEVELASTDPVNAVKASTEG